VWFDTANNSAPKRWSGIAWESAEDPRIGLNTAAIASEATTRANADSALGQRIDTVIADVGTNAAAIQSEATARANADSALSNTLTTVSAQATRARTFRQSTAPVSPQAGDVWYDTSANNVAKRWSGTAWESTEDPRIGQNTAAITSEATARANADSALAGTLTTVQTTVGEHTATIQQQAQSIDGLSAQYTVKVDVNGYVSGFGLATTAKDGVPTSTFTVLAEKFEITAPGGSKISPFVVQNGTVYLRSVVIGSGWIGDAHIGPNGISASHLKANSVLTDSIRVGSSSGSTLSTVASQAATGASDPAARINAGSTTIGPGRVRIEGATTLDGWRSGTEINGGAIKTNSVEGDRIKADSMEADRLKAGAITSRELATTQLISQSSQLGNAVVKTLSIGANQVTVPITSGVMHPGYLPDHDVVLAECYTIEGVGQPIRITASGMHTLDAYGSQDWGQSTAVFRFQRGTWSPTTGWSWVDLVADLGGSMSMRDISAATGVSKPWSFGVTDREPPAVSLAYRLVGRRIVPWNIVSLAYWSIEATEYRR